MVEPLEARRLLSFSSIEVVPYTGSNPVPEGYDVYDLVATTDAQWNVADLDITLQSGTLFRFDWSAVEGLESTDPHKLWADSPTMMLLAPGAEFSTGVVAPAGPSSTIMLATPTFTATSYTGFSFGDLTDTGPDAGVRVARVVVTENGRGTLSGRMFDTDGEQAFSLDFGPQPAGPDIDGDGLAEALTDGVLIVRHLFGFTGSNLTTGALAPDATRTDPAAIATLLDDVIAELDIDGNGRTDALSDGVLIVRHLFGFTGSDLTTGALAPDATRTDPADVGAFIGGISVSSAEALAGTWLNTHHDPPAAPPLLARLATLDGGGWGLAPA